MVGAIRTLQAGGAHPILPEGKQIVAFHQVTNRICAENAQALRRAFPVARSRIELLAYLSRATGWGVSDLTTVTPPRRMEADFVQEIEMRRQVQHDLLGLQKAFETGDDAARGRVDARLATTEARAKELNQFLGLRTCAPVLPARTKGVIHP